MGIRLEINGKVVDHFEHLGMDNGALDVSPASQRKPYNRSQTTLSALDLDILNQQKNATNSDNVSVKYFSDQPRWSRYGRICNIFAITTLHIAAPTYN